jgi:hypothetical protein
MAERALKPVCAAGKLRSSPAFFGDAFTALYLNVPFSREITLA